MRRPAFLIAALALGACAPVALPAPVRDDGRAILNQATRVGALVVIPRAVIEDSRCPANVQCIWAGRAIVRVEVDGATGRKTVDLTLGEPVTVDALPLTLTAVEPYPVAGAARAPSAATSFAFEGGR